jgi:hypothetical protein
MTRAEHLKWCKDRAFELADQGDVIGAWGSFLSDMRKHPETEDHMALPLGMMLMAGGHNRTPDEMRRFIEGFN